MPAGEKSLNLGNFYVNGIEVVRPESAKGNFFANNVGMFTDATLNDNSKSTRLDVQLNMGATISDRDRGANDILKKMLGQLSLSRVDLLCLRRCSTIYTVELLEKLSERRSFINLQEWSLSILKKTPFLKNLTL